MWESHAMTRPKPRLHKKRFSTILSFFLRVNQVTHMLVITKQTKKSWSEKSATNIKTSR